jgi:ubiquitin carboxyl-terminal hydrolase 6/32
MESKNSSIDGVDLQCSTDDLRPPLDRPLGSRDPTPPILLAPEDDDRLVGNTEIGFRARNSEEGGSGSPDPGMESHDSKMGGSEELDSPTTTSPAASPLHCGDLHDGFIFAIHRKTFLTEQYFVASQKNRPVLFGIPVVVPCTPSTPCREVYQMVWRSVERLIIPDRPSQDKQSTRKSDFPFKLSLVGKDGLSCATCPWHKFCRGCAIECGDSAIGDSSPYIAIDWDVNTLHLKYQSAQERPVEHKSMESLKTMDLDPIDLYECFKAFVREDDLGDEECWYCKQCERHQEAVKSLEIWRLPPILIIHLKRFQFVNGRWVKSQRMVRFPVSNLEPLRYTVQNGNDTEARPSSSQSVEGGDTTISPPDTRPQVSEDTEIGTDTTLLANGGENPVISDERISAVNSGTGGGEGGDTEQDQLDKTLHRRKGTIYNLVAITCHSGVLGGGHYTSFCRNPNGMWYYFNDSSCKETSEERIIEESPYMLFYEMKDLDHYYNLFRAQKGGKQQDISSTEDDRAYEETLHNLSKKCCIQ